MHRGGEIYSTTEWGGGAAQRHPRRTQIDFRLAVHVRHKVPYNKCQNNVLRVRSHAGVWRRVGRDGRRKGWGWGGGGEAEGVV